MISHHQGCDSRKQSPLLAQSIFTEEKLLIKLRTALRYAVNTCLLGASNKFHDIQKTNAWVLFPPRRYHLNGQYVKHVPSTATTDSFNLSTDAFNLKIDSENPYHIHKTASQWTYDANIEKSLLSVKYRLEARTEQSPLENSRFNNEHFLLLASAMLALIKRQGNCAERAALCVKNLWENHGGLIHRLEVVETVTFDHCIVIVNRSASSQLNDPNNWGHAWIIDCWYKKKGLIFPAFQFRFYMDKIKEFALLQDKEFEKLGFSFDKTNMDKETLSDVALQEIHPQIDPYPTYSQNPFYPIEYYYTFANDYPMNLYENISIFHEEHQKKFSDCLKELQRVNKTSHFKMRK